MKAKKEVCVRGYGIIERRHLAQIFFRGEKT